FDKNIMKALKNILTSEDLAKEYINIDHDEKEISILKNRIKSVEKTLTDLSGAADRLLDLYLSGGLKKDKYIEKEKEFNSKIIIQEEELNKLKRKLNVIESSSFTYENLYQYMELTRNLETELTNLEKAQLMG